MKHNFLFKYEEGDSVEVRMPIYADPSIKCEPKYRWLYGTVLRRARTCIGGVPTDDKIYTLQITGALPDTDIVRDMREEDMRLSTVGYMRRKKNATKMANED